jgi:hypothetical protein
MNISLQRKIHYLSLATLFMGGLGLLEGKWLEVLAGAVLCLSSAFIAALLLPALLRSGKESRWNKTAFLWEFILMLLLAVFHVFYGHYPLSAILAILSLLPALAWIQKR